MRRSFGRGSKWCVIFRCFFPFPLRHIVTAVRQIRKRFAVLRTTVILRVGQPFPPPLFAVVCLNKQFMSGQGMAQPFFFCRPSPPQAKYGRRGERSPIFPRLPTEPQIRASLGHEKTLFPSFAAIRSSAKQKREGRGGGGVCGVCDAHQHFYMARKSEGARRQEKVAEKGAEEEEATTKGRGRNAAAHLKGKREEEESDDASHSTSSSSPLLPLLLPQENPTALPLLSLSSSVLLLLLLLLFLLPASTQRKKETAEDGTPNPPPPIHTPPPPPPKKKRHPPPSSLRRHFCV